jgi:hypothetical protein
LEPSHDHLASAEVYGHGTPLLGVRASPVAWLGLPRLDLCLADDALRCT